VIHEDGDFATAIPEKGQAAQGGGGQNKGGKGGEDGRQAAKTGLFPSC